MSKLITIPQAVSLIKPGSRLMVGGFLGCGSPDELIKAIASSTIDDLHIIANDTSTPDFGVGVLVAERKASQVTVSHIGTNPLSGKLMVSGDLTVNLVPQGTLAEAIRAKGAGLGGVLTKTGIGTIVADGKQVVSIDGDDFLLEKSIGADVAIIRAKQADTLGNLIYDKSARNQNPLMAMAADVVIAQVDEVVEAGSLDPEHIITPSIFVDYVVGADNG